MSKQDIEATGKPTPVAGCTIFLVILGMVSFLSIFAWYQYGEYKDAIVSISETEKKETPVIDLTNQTAETQALDLKMGTFEQAVKKGEKAEISFTVEEMNLAIAHYENLKPFRGEMSFTEITNDAIIADISYPVRAGFDGIRYLNGTMTMKPHIAMGSLFPEVTDIQANTCNPVPPKMSREFPTLMFTEYRNDEELAKVFHKLSTVTLSDGKMTILSDPAVAQPDALPDDVSSETNRALWVFGLLVFMFTTTVAFLLWVRKRKQNA